MLNSLTGYNNTWTYGSTLTYVFYWLFIIGYLLYAFWSEGRLALTLPGSKKHLWESKRRIQMREEREKRRCEKLEKKAEEGRK